LDETRFKSAKETYAAGDYRAAAREFLEAAGKGSGGGAALHQAGNALMHLKRYEDAATVYSHALEDVSYEHRGAVAANLGFALRAREDLEGAVKAFDSALNTPGYPRRYKALLGKAGALYELGRLEEAASAYRSAAIEATNSDPGKALNNLGLTYMALGRPQDGVEAYRTALDMDGYEGRGRTAANLGIAYSTLGRHNEALEMFGIATEQYGFRLSEGFQEAYHASTDAVVKMMADEPSSEGSEAVGVLIPVDETETDFFTRTDAEMRHLDKQARREERIERRSHIGTWVRVGVVIAVVATIMAATAMTYAAGYGWPTQETTVSDLMDAHAAGEPVGEFWVAVPTEDVEKEMDKLPPNHTSYTIDRVERGASESLVMITITLEEGAPLCYEIALDREGVGWRVIGVDNDWRSTGGGS